MTDVGSGWRTAVGGETAPSGHFEYPGRVEVGPSRDYCAACMSTGHSIQAQLDAIEHSASFEEESGRLVDAWTGADVGLAAVEPILKFMETHPAIDYGSPGALVHFIERFWMKGYEERLVASLNRRPTEHTTWLLNRVINGVKDSPVRDGYIAIMRDIASNAAIEDEARALAADFFARLGH